MKFCVNKTARAMKGKRFVAQKRGMSGGAKGRGSSGYSSVVKAGPTDRPKLPQARGGRQKSPVNSNKRHNAEEIANHPSMNSCK